MNSKTIKIIGTLASAMAVMMYVSYIPQIMDNLAGHKGNPLQPAVAFLNCILWTWYGWGQKPKDWPLIAANVPGIFLAAVTAVTALL